MTALPTTLFAHVLRALRLRLEPTGGDAFDARRSLKLDYLEQIEEPT